jgi:hypothetical protein
MHYTPGGDTTFVSVNGNVLAASSGESVAIMKWPLTTNSQDDVTVRNPGLNPSQPVFNNFYLSNGTTVGSVPAYGATHGQAFGPTPDGSANWTSGPGGNLNRIYFEQFVINTKEGFGATIDSIILNASFYNSSSNTKLAIGYSLSGFEDDSANVTGGTGPSGILAGSANGGFTTPVFLLNQTGGNTNNYRFALNQSTGVNLGADETLTVRMYFSCGSTSAGRYAKIKDVIVKGKVSNVLPVNLLGFDGWEKDKGAFLSWSAAGNDQLDYFLMERKNPNEEFLAIHKIKSSGLAGNSHYEYFDFFSQDGDVFYRLKMVDKDGSFRYSPVVIVKHKLQAGFKIFPNPAATSVTVVHTDREEILELQLVNAAGQIIYRQAVMAGSKQSTLNVQSLKAGLYNVVVKSKNKTRVAGFIKL